MEEKILIPFEGEGSGTAGLTWGQQTIWRAFETAGMPIWLTAVKPVYGETVEELTDQLAFMISRNQSMRTRLIVSDEHPIQQVVYTSGEVEVQIVDVDDDADPLAIAKALEDDLGEHQVAYDYANDWPVRMIIIRHLGEPAYRVLATSHVVTDGFGVLAMQADLAARDPVTGSPDGPNIAMQPLEEAEWQASPAGKRRSMMAEQHWQRLLRSIPARRFPEPDEVSEPRFNGRAQFESRAAFLAVRAISERAQVNSSPVLLAAACVGLARATGVNPVVPRVYVSNRFRPRLAKAVSPIAQTCPCVIDVAGITFDEAVKRTYYASLNAYKNGYFEPVKIRELLAATSEERGEQIDLNCIYNDIRLDTPRETKDTPAGQEEIRAALPLSKLSWEGFRPEDVCNILIQDSPDTIKILMLVDSHYISQAHVEKFLWEMEAVLVDAAFNPQAPTGI